MRKRIILDDLQLGEKTLWSVKLHFAPHSFGFKYVIMIISAVVFQSYVCRMEFLVFSEQISVSKKGQASS